MAGLGRRCAVLVLAVTVVIGGLRADPVARAENNDGGEGVSVGSFNILTYRDKNNAPPTAWHEPDNRSRMIPRIMRDNDWDVVGLQEVGTALARDDGSMTPSPI